MKWIKKVAVTPLETVAKVIDSLSGASTTNAPSIKAVNTAIDGLLSAIDAKQDKITLTASKAVVTNSSGKLTASGTTATQIGYLNSLTGNVQTQINNLKNALNDKTQIAKESKNVAVIATEAQTVYSASFTFSASPNYEDIGLYTVYTDTPNVRIDSVARVDGVSSFTYYVLYHGVTNNAAGGIYINVYFSSTYEI